MTDVTRILNAIERGDSQASNDLLPLVYEELRLLAAQKLSQEPPGQTLQATAHSLGVLLYELLTWTPPFGQEELPKAGYLEMQRIIREQEALRPSTKPSILCGTLTDVAKHCGPTPDMLRKVVRGDLDWIMMKTLEKDRARGGLIGD